MLIATVAGFQQAGPPTAPALDAPGVHGCTPYGVSLRWAPAQDDTRVARYEVAVDHLGEGSSPTVVDTIEAPAEQPAAYEHFVDGESDYPLVPGRT